jgi:hypothetical protein
MNSEVLGARREIARIAGDALSGAISFIRASRMITAIKVEAGLDFDADIVPFIAFDSQTDHLPVEERIRALWAKASLAAMQPEIDQWEAWALVDLGPHCRSLIARFPPT